MSIGLACFQAAHVAQDLAYWLHAEGHQGKLVLSFSIGLLAPSRWVPLAHAQFCCDLLYSC